MKKEISETAEMQKIDIYELLEISDPERSNMMMKMNCWEYKNCADTGCPSLREERFDGFNSGKNGGRMCWYTKKIASGNKGKGEQAGKCSQCDFFSRVEQEENSNLVIFV
ncbi:MAG: two-CW domain-containing protein [Nitrospirota bacterium]